jgi:hypothetical protein
LPQARAAVEAGNNTPAPIRFETSHGGPVIQDNAIARQPRFAYLQGMEVHFTSEQEAQLAQLATKAGTNAEHLVKDAVLRLLEEAGGLPVPSGSVVNEMRALRARVKPDPEGWTTRDYVNYGRQ